MGDELHSNFIVTWIQPQQPLTCHFWAELGCHAASFTALLLIMWWNSNLCVLICCKQIDCDLLFVCVCITPGALMALTHLCGALFRLLLTFISVRYQCAKIHSEHSNRSPVRAKLNKIPPHKCAHIPMKSLCPFFYYFWSTRAAGCLHLTMHKFHAQGAAGSCVKFISETKFRKYWLCFSTTTEVLL